jgi:ribosomal protein S18 acetylase RimI-like enzyme
MSFSAAQVAGSHAAPLHAFRRMAELSGGEWRQESGLLLYRTPVHDPVVWNGAVLTGAVRERPAHVLERADTFFGPHATSYGFWVVGSRDVELAAFLSAHGAESIDDMPHMVLAAGSVSGTRSSVPVDLVVDQAGRRAFVEVAAASFETIGADPETWRVIYASLVSVCAADVIAVVATVDGQHVGAAMGYIDDGFCEVIHVATIPSARRRGIGKAVTTRVLAEAHARGASLAALQSTKHGEGVYRSLGFEEIDRYSLHLRTLPTV